MDALDAYLFEEIEVKTVTHMRSGPAVLALLAAAGHAFAQLQVQQGHALDANPLVGSGGSNTPVQGYVPINGNDIVTGNVRGLAYFHAPVGTTSPYVFQGNLGTSSLNNFSRLSAGGIPTSANSGLNSVYYLPSTTVSTAQGALYSAPAVGGFDSRLVPMSSVAPTAGVNGNVPEPMVSGLPVRAFDVGDTLRANALGQPGGPITSPLFGLRTGEQPATGGVKTAPGEAIVPMGGQGTGGRPGDAPAENDRNGARGNGGESNGLTARGPVNTRVDTRVRGGAESGAIPDDRMRVTGAYESLLQQLERARDGSRAGDTGSVNSERNVTLNGETLRPGENRGRGGGGSGALPRGNNTPGQNTPMAAGARSGSLAAGPDGTQSTDPTRGNYHPDLTPRQASANSGIAGESSETLRAGRSVGELKALAAPAGVGTQAPAFEELMKRGEERMKAGKFMESADVFQQALSNQPNNALAVLGRGHAELAAGMYESAAGDLQFVFTKKPELVSVKYALGDYLPLDRQVFLTDDLRKLSQGKETGNMASFLLCYLSYQTGRGEELKAELDRWAARPWRDAWQVVAEKAWR